MVLSHGERNDVVDRDDSRFGPESGGQHFLTGKVNDLSWKSFDTSLVKISQKWMCAMPHARWKFCEGSDTPPPSRTAIVMAFAIFVNAAPFLTSETPFCHLICAHFECPLIYLHLVTWY